MALSINLCQFLTAFEKLRPNNFTLTGLREMYNFFQFDIDNFINFDVIAICCEFTEYYKNENALHQINEEYGTEFKTLDDVRERTIVIESDVSVIIQNF